MQVGDYYATCKGSYVAQMASFRPQFFVHQTSFDHHHVTGILLGIRNRGIKNVTAFPLEKKCLGKWGYISLY